MLLPTIPSAYPMPRQAPTVERPATVAPELLWLELPGPEEPPSTRWDAVFSRALAYASPDFAIDH